MDGITSSGVQGVSSAGLRHSSRSELHWFLIFTKPSSEKTAELNLERQGYRVYLPRLADPAFRRGRWIQRVVSLFPRYLFVQLDPKHQSLAPVRSTIGVASIVRFGRESTIVPGRIVETLMSSADPGSGLHRISRSRKLEPGSRVDVVGGALEGLRGIFEREAGDERVVILLKLLGEQTAVQVSSQFVVCSE